MERNGLRIGMDGSSNAERLDDGTHSRFIGDMDTGLLSPGFELMPDASDIDSLLPFPANLPEQYKALVAQIENSKHPNHPFILRQVYEAGHLKNFLQYLDKRAEARDAEIERVCAQHTLTLTEAARDLMRMSKGIEELRGNLAQGRESGKLPIEDLKKAAGNVTACNYALTNTTLLMERINLLKPVITTVSEAHVCMEKGELVKALRKLHDAWERTRKLPHHIRLVKSLADSIPRMKAQIIKEAISGITTSLESIRNVNLRAGFLTMQNVCKTADMTLEPFIMEPGRILAIRYKEELAFLNDRNWNIESAINLEPLLTFRHLMLNFEPDDLSADMQKTYMESYAMQRRNQIAQLVQPPNHMHSVDHFRLYIQDVVGIFALERHISLSVPGLSTDGFYLEQWKDVCLDVIGALKSHLTFITDENDCSALKRLISLFALTMKSLHLDSSKIYIVLEEVGDLYGEILLRSLLGKMNHALSGDKFTPISAASKEELKRELGDFPYTPKTDNGAELKFPLQLPFSSSVPKFYSLIKEYISTYVQFNRNMSANQPDKVDKVRRAISTVLSRNVRGCICGEVGRGQYNPAQLVQLYFNCNYLEYSCQFLEDWAASCLNLSPSSSQPMKVDYDSLFKDIRSQIEQQLYTSLMLSVEAMIGESQFDSAAQEPSHEASPLAVRVTRYLEAVFASIRSMPYGVCQTAWMTALKHIGNQLQETFVHKSSVITIGGVQQLKTDLVYYEDFLLRQRDHTDPSTLLLAFADLRQLTDLLLLWDWNTYFHEHGKKDAKYNRVQPQTALLVLDKMKESDRKKGNMLDNFRKSEREKKKLFDTIMNQLKELTLEASHQ